MILVDNGSQLLEDAQRASELAVHERDLNRCDRAMEDIERIRIALDNKGETRNTVELQMASMVMAGVQRRLGMDERVALEDNTAGSLGGYLKEALVQAGKAIMKLLRAVWDIMRRLAGRMSMSSSRLAKTAQYFDKVVREGAKQFSFEDADSGTPDYAKFLRLATRSSGSFSTDAVVHELEKSTKFIKEVLKQTAQITDTVMDLHSNEKMEFILTELAKSMDQYVKSTPYKDNDEVGNYCGYKSTICTGYEPRTYYASIPHNIALHQSMFTSVKTDEHYIGPEERPEKLTNKTITKSEFDSLKGIMRICADMNSVEAPNINALFSKLERSASKLLTQINKATPEDEENIRATYMATRFISNNYVKALLVMVRHVNSIVEDTDAAVNVFCHRAR